MNRTNPISTAHTSPPRIISGSQALPVEIEDFGATADSPPTTNTDAVTAVHLQELEARMKLETYKRSLSYLLHDVRNFIVVAIGGLLPAGNSDELSQFHGLIRTFALGSGTKETPTLITWINEACAVGNTKEVLSYSRVLGGQVESTCSLMVDTARKIEQQSISPVKETVSVAIGCLERVLKLIQRFNQTDGDADNLGVIEKVELAKLVRHFLDIIENDSVIRDTLNLSLTISGNLAVEIDPTKFDSCMMNLINNAAKAARKFKPDGKTDLNINIEEREGNIVISFSDNGPGIPEDIIGKIFERGFSTTSGETKAIGGGENKGFGLPNVKDIVEAAGGSITVESSHRTQCAESFTTFTITLPKAEPGAPLVAVTGEIRPLNNGPFRILVVDDDADSNQLLLMVLKMSFTANNTPQGCNSTAAITFDEAEGLLKESTPDKLPHLMILDFKLPGGRNGTELVRLLEGRGVKGVKSILMTGFNREHIEGSVPHGVDVLTKPISYISTLVPIISAHMNSIPEYRLPDKK